jgi:hypothetical protein
MNKNIHPVDDLFGPLGQHTETPPPLVWQGVEQHLDRKSHARLRQKYKAIQRVAALLLLLLISGVVYYAATKNNSAANGSSTAQQPLRTPESTLPAGAQPVTKQPAAASGQPPVNSLAKTATASNDVDAAAENNTGLSVTAVNQNTISALTNTVKQKKFTVAAALKAVRLWSSRPKNKNEGFDMVSLPMDIRIPGEEALALPEREILLSVSPFNIKDLLPAVSAPAAANRPTALFPANRLPPAKTPAKPATPRGRWFINVFAAPEFLITRLKDDEPHFFGSTGGPRPADDDRRKLKDEERKTSSFSTGVLVQYALFKHIRIGSGISYIQKTTEIAPKKIYAELDNGGTVKFRYNCASGTSYLSPKDGSVTVIGDSASATSAENRLSYLHIPFTVSYTFTHKKISVSPFAGAGINVLLKEQIETEVTDALGSEHHRVTDIKGLKKTYLSGSLGLQFAYTLNKKCAVLLAPAARFAISSLNEHSNVKSFPLALGLQAGLQWRL